MYKVLLRQFDYSVHMHCLIVGHDVSNISGFITGETAKIKAFFVY